jgi:ABC-type glycerol-3-phosphate transport system substrate-binding protein
MAIAALIVLAVAAVGFAEVVNVMHGWPGEQAPAFQKIVDAFEAEHPDIDVVVEIVGRDRPTILATRLAAGNPPDLTPHPWIGLMKEWADAGEIVDLAGLVDTSDINPALVPIGEYDGGLYGLFIFPNVKSLVWYSPKLFAAKGYEVPTTWYELLELSDRMVADFGLPVVDEELTLPVSVGAADAAALVTYPVFQDGQQVVEFINEITFVPGSPIEVTGLLSNFDVHNIYRTEFNDFDLYLIGNIDTSCILWTYDVGRWGAATVTDTPPSSPYYPGVTIRWANASDPVPFCRKRHFGVKIDPRCRIYEVRAFWTVNGDPGPEIPMPWQFWEPAEDFVLDVIPPIEIPVEIQRRITALPEPIPLRDLLPTTINEIVQDLDRSWLTVDLETGAPWSIGLESGAASGWPGTDWIEDIMLRTAGPDIYDKWVNHEIPWTDPRVKLAFETFGSLFDRGHVLGGEIGALTTNFGDAADPVYAEPASAFMHKQATFIQGFFNDHIEGLVAGEDYNVFPLPTITPKATPDGSIPLLVSGDVVTVFNNRPEVIAFAQFLTSETAANIWSSELGELSAYVNADPAQFENPITRTAQEMLLNATVSRFDGSDLMPGAIGAGAFWSGVLDYVSGIDLDTVLETIEAAAQEAY